MTWPTAASSRSWYAVRPWTTRSNWIRVGGCTDADGVPDALTPRVRLAVCDRDGVRVADGDGGCVTDGDSLSDADGESDAEAGAGDSETDGE